MVVNANGDLTLVRVLEAHREFLLGGGGAVGPSGGTLVAPGPSDELLRAFANAGNLVAQTTPYEEDPITVIFNAQEISSAVGQVADACGWRLE